MITINGRENPQKLAREDIMAMVADDAFQIEPLPIMQFEAEFELELIEAKPGRLAYEGEVEEWQVKVEVVRIPDDRFAVHIDVTSPDGGCGFGSF
ncbi:hypothetical protein D3C87_1276280 [compost metagenome]